MNVLQRTVDLSPNAALPKSATDSLKNRSEPRIDVWLEGATLREPGCNSAPVKLHDLSARGFRTEWPYLMARGNRVWLKLPNFEAWSALVAWNHRFELGCKFETPLHPAVFDRIVHAHTAR